MKTNFFVHVVDDDDAVRDSLCEVFDAVGLPSKGFSSATEFTEYCQEDTCGCVVSDVRMPGMSGLELLTWLKAQKSIMSIVFITGYADVPMAVDAIKQGAYAFIQKPFREQELLDCVSNVMADAKENHEQRLKKKQILKLIQSLTDRERETLDLISEGHPNKVIADKMGISQRTVENHRSNLLEKLQVPSTAALIKVLVTANSAI